MGWYDWGRWVQVPPGGGGSYWQCSHQGCKKKASLLREDGYDHDCCGRIGGSHGTDHHYAQQPPAPPPVKMGDVLRAAYERWGKR